MWCALWGGQASALQSSICQAFAKGFCSALEESTLQHYVSDGFGLTGSLQMHALMLCLT